jgi:hypothetical protein
MACWLSSVQRPPAHFCVRALLTRQEIASSIRIILQRLKDIEIVDKLPHPILASSLNFLALKKATGPLQQNDLISRARGGCPSR